MNSDNIKPEVLIIGDLLIDNLCYINSIPLAGQDEKILKMTRLAGGSAANTCFVLSNLGIKSYFCGPIGNDSDGRRISAEMERLGINVSCAPVVNDNTGYTITLIESSGERTMLSYRGAASHKLHLNTAILEAMSHIKLSYASGYMLPDDEQAEFIISVFKESKKRGIITALDTSPVIGRVNNDILEEIFLYTDILMPNAGELLAVTGETSIENAMKSIIKRVPAVLVKQGAAGARILVSDAFPDDYFPQLKTCNLSAPAEKVTPRDTTGAGDSFNAGFIAALINGKSCYNCLEAGNRTASDVITGRLCRSILL